MRREITLRVPVTGAAARLVVECEEGPAGARQMEVGAILVTLEAGAATAVGVLSAAAAPELVEALQRASVLSLLPPSEVPENVLVSEPVVATPEVDVPVPEVAAPAEEPAKVRSHHKR